MPEVSFDNLLIIFLIAVGVPLLLGLGPRWRVPSVVIEIIAGVIVGPSVLGWVQIDLPVQILAIFGLAFLLFLAGVEIDLRRLRGRLLHIALLGYVVTLILGIGVGAVFGLLGWVQSPLLVAITLSATSLGLVVPVLKDARQVNGETGQLTIASSSVADFAAIALLTLFFSASGGSVGEKASLLVIFAALVAVGAGLLLRVRHSVRLGSVLVRLQDTTAEIRVRCAVLLLVGLVAVAAHLGLEIILGAFLAGALVGLIDRDTSSHPRFRTKIEAIGFGFLIPVFFISSGVRLDLSGLLDDPSALLRVPLFLLALLVVRGRAGPALRAAARSVAHTRVRSPAGDIAAVHRDGKSDRGGRRRDDPRDRGGVGVRRSAVGDDLPGDRPRAAADRAAEHRIDHGGQHGVSSDQHVFGRPGECSFIRAPRSVVPGSAAAQRASPARYAMSAICTRLVVPSLSNRCPTWLFTVASLRKSRWPISRVGQALADLDQHLPFTRGEDVQPAGGLALPLVAGSVGELGDHPPGHGRGQHRVTVVHGDDGPDEFLWRGVLEQEAGRAGLQRPEDVVVGVEGGQHDDRGRVLQRADRRGGGDAVQPGHPDVHQHDIGPVTSDGVDGVRPVSCLAHHLQFRARLDDHPDPDPDEGLVVDQQYPDHDVTDRGNSAATRHPPSTRGPLSSDPPASRQRSASPTRPKPLPGNVITE